MKKLLSLCPIADAGAKKEISAFYEITELPKCTEEELYALAGTFEALIVPYTADMLVSERVIDKAENLEIIASAYGGTRQNIADIYAIRKGISVLHTGASRERPMAEYTLALVLCSFLRIANYHHDMCAGEWPRFKYPRTRILKDRKVAVVGYGRIGKAIAGRTEGSASVSIPGLGNSASVHGADPGNFGVELGVGFSIPLGKDCGSLLLDCSAEFYSDQTSVNGILGYQCTF